MSATFAGSMTLLDGYCVRLDEAASALVVPTEQASPSKSYLVLGAGDSVEREGWRAPWVKHWKKKKKKITTHYSQILRVEDIGRRRRGHSLEGLMKGFVINPPPHKHVFFYTGIRSEIRTGDHAHSCGPGKPFESDTDSSSFPGLTRPDSTKVRKALDETFALISERGRPAEYISWVTTQRCVHVRSEASSVKWDLSKAVTDRSGPVGDSF
ncbi:hypothetical protein EDB84DRAFT_1616240 [Lactarius hengduanensis]|nr:hypothetical protein EDB84DRAFT_1616240 [Lactarius hengduanensis]